MMRHVLVSLLLFGLFLFPSCAAAAPKQAAVILAGNYWDGMSDGPLGAAEILVVDGRIAEVGKSVARPEGARVIDLEKSRRHPLRLMCALRDLHSLNYYSQSIWSRTDRLRFLEKYLGIPRLNGYARWLWHRLEARFGKKSHARRGGQ